MKFKTKPFQHQIDGIKYGLTHDKWLLGDEQGLGKTCMAINIATIKKEKQHYKHCLIVCGVNSLKWNWVEEVNKHSYEESHILGYRREGLSIGSKEKIQDLKNIEKINQYFIITNIESLRDNRIVDLLVELCKKNIINMIVLDEAHKVKQSTSMQGKGLLKLQAETMIAMTGTPLMNTPIDLYSIFKWLGFEKHSLYQFKQHYCIMGGFGGHEITGYRHLDELQKKLDSMMLRRLKSEVLDLPEKTYVNEYVEMSKKQQTIYNEVFSEIKSNIDKIKMVNNPLTELIRLRQATGYTGILSTTIKESAKLDRMEELVEEAVSNNQKVVIFTNWTQICDEINNRLSKKFSGVTITGQTPDSKRQLNVNRFQNNPKCNYITGTIGAMGTGLTLSAGTVVIFLDEAWNMALKEQAVDRCHRIGQKSNITIYTLICRGTIDEKINQLVERKGKMADSIIDGEIFNKDEIIDFLLS